MIKKRKILIFDTNIFLSGIEFNLIDGIIYTTPSVIEEIKVKRYIDKNRNILNRIEAAIESKKLILNRPSNLKYIQEIEKKSEISGDYRALSGVDKELIALALEIKETLTEDVVIYTNDYSMENICSLLNLAYSPLNKKGIKSKIIWQIYCPFCLNDYKAKDLFSTCETCGSKLKRRPKK